MRWKQFKTYGIAVAALLWSTVLGSAAGAASPQSGAEAPQTTLVGELQSLAGRASVIFTGQVISVEHRGGVVEITFHVEQAVSGGVGDTYTLREWAGLWPAGQFRYSVGQRALLFLHAASDAGLGSPVDGADGVVPVVVQGADAPELLDVRRLSAAILRKPGVPLLSEAQGAIQLTDAIALITNPVSLGRPSAALPIADPVHLPLSTRVASQHSTDPGTVQLPGAGDLTATGLPQTGAGDAGMVGVRYAIR